MKIEKQIREIIELIAVVKDERDLRVQRASMLCRNKVASASKRLLKLATEFLSVQDDGVFVNDRASFVTLATEAGEGMVNALSAQSIQDIASKAMKLAGRKCKSGRPVAAAKDEVQQLVDLARSLGGDKKHAASLLLSARRLLLK